MIDRKTELEIEHRINRRWLDDVLAQDATAIHLLKVRQEVIEAVLKGMEQPVRLGATAFDTGTGPSWEPKEASDGCNAELLPRCSKLDGSTLSIVPAYTEAGYFTEANCVTIRDAEGRMALYVPHHPLPAPPSGVRCSTCGKTVEEAGNQSACSNSWHLTYAPSVVAPEGEK